jgi:hypothetical protein
VTSITCKHVSKQGACDYASCEGAADCGSAISARLNLPDAAKHNGQFHGR